MEPAARVRTVADLGLALRELRRRQARRRGGAPLSYRELAAATGWSHGIIGEYLSGRVLPPTDRFDALVRLLGASPAEQGALATARDRVEEARRRPTATFPGVPRQLPADTVGFTGRVRELEALDALLVSGSPAILAALAGTAGVGKTALAVHWAHRVAGRFPDGQLYVDLRGYDPDRPVPAADALAGFLRALGVPAAEVPVDPAERAARYRSLLAGRRVLVVLDNAGDADQVRPLLPGDPGCFALVTSRSDLAGLVVREGAWRVDLDLLRADEAVRLLRTHIGDRTGADPDATAALAECCARLPLALRVVAEIATGRPDLPLSELVADLRDEGRRLDLLDVAGDPRSAVRAVFSWSLGQLSPPAADAFARLGLHPGRDVDGYALAALADVPPERAGALLDELRRAHLVTGTGPGRYGMHDLLRAYATERAAGLRDGDAARVRLYDYYLATAAAAVDRLFPHDRPLRPAVAPAGTAAPRLTDQAAAAGWLDRERANLVAVATLAGPRHAVAVSGLLWRHFEVGGHYQEALTVHTTAVAAARDGGLPAGALPATLTNLGSIHWWLGNHATARAHFEEALDGYRRIGEAEGEARALARLALVHERLGDYPAALDRLSGALAIYRRTGNRHGQGAQLINLGTLLRRLGRYDESVARQRAAAGLFARLGDRRLEAYALGNLGAVESLLGRHADALDHLTRSLAACRDAGDRGGEGSALATIGAVYQRMGRYPEALDHLDRGLRISRETGDRGLEIESLNGLGATLYAMGLPRAALGPHRAALALATAAGDRYERARALDGLANGLAAQGDPAADRYRRRAGDGYRALGISTPSR